MAFINLDSVSVDFPIYNMHTRSLKKRLLHLTTGGQLIHHQDCIVIKALDQVSFYVEDGDRVALIGHNGAGKSTLLRVLANIYVPSRGTIQYKGKISTLFNVMLGLNHESTGYENILCRGYMLGLTRKQMLSKIDEIVDFTELGDYLYVPIRTYSSGMLMRLAFAVATSIEADIVLIDEIIGTGDKHFIDKAKKRLFDFATHSNIVVMTSHATEIIKNICNKALIMQSGRVVWFGPMEKVPQAF